MTMADKGLKKEEEEEKDRILMAGKPNYDRCDNKITTSRYTIWSFIPVATMEQFRRFANLYFLLVGCIMAVGFYSPLFESAISPWTTLGPLAVVISFSLLVEGWADKKRHANDVETNQAPCVVLRRADELDTHENNENNSKRDATILNGKDVKVNLKKAYYTGAATETPVNSSSISIAFSLVARQNIRQGHVVLIKNREMIPADIILLASSSDNGSAYIETSSIDGETNLKLRTSPQLPKHVMKQMKKEATCNKLLDGVEQDDDDDDLVMMETLEQATKRVTRFSALAYPHGKSALMHPQYGKAFDEDSSHNLRNSSRRRSSLKDVVLGGIGHGIEAVIGNTNNNNQENNNNNIISDDDDKYVATLTSEPPNPHVNTFSGKLTLPPLETYGPCFDIPLGAENILLRGAVLRNTEWALGLACFTGTDTKLIQNSFDTPSKFSQLDRLMNKTVAAILCLMVLVISYLATHAVIANDKKFDQLWYAGFNTDTNMSWPYLEKLPPPQWTTQSQNWVQTFFLYVTLLNNFVPLSLYVTVEIVTFCMLFFIYVDLSMYDAKSDTRAVARSTNVTDLGQVKYIFSDKTGTLTQNVMRFKRCSVDGMTFGAPITKSRPDSDEEQPENQGRFHPLRQLLVGRVNVNRDASVERGLEGLGGNGNVDVVNPQDDGKLTFNAEMFLRVMSLCHTVVVEKDLDQSTNIDASKSVSSHQSSGWSDRAKRLFGSNNKKHTSSDISDQPDNNNIKLPTVLEMQEHDPVGDRPRLRTLSNEGSALGDNTGNNKNRSMGADGAPSGFAYQAESPDEGALVSAAAKTFGFQVVGRDSSGIRLQCSSPSHLQERRVTTGLASGQLSLKCLAAETANVPEYPQEEEEEDSSASCANTRLETWNILAVNKFDSDRKRMSILLRSPPELGNLPILFCKGADSAMLDPDVCGASASESLMNVMEEEQDSSMDRRLALMRANSRRRASEAAELTTVSEDTDDNLEAAEEWEMAQMLGVQSHLGDFASEGLRTLVLGMKILTERECTDWLEQYKTAATSIKNRDELLTQAGLAIEKELHIVGATAIEDKLQVGVPNTIATLEQAGIKLWVLTGDKRETAIEIGYSTHVLTPNMHLTEVADKGIDHVRTLMAMEFIRLIKMGKLVKYQRKNVDKLVENECSKEKMYHVAGKYWRGFIRQLRKVAVYLRSFFVDKEITEFANDIIDADAEDEEHILMDTVRRRNVRNRAEEIIHGFLTTHGKQQKEPSTPLSEDALTSDDVPKVFHRAQSARKFLDLRKSQGHFSKTDLRALSIAQLTAQQSSASQQLKDDDNSVVDEDILSIRSFFPDASAATSDFDRRKRTILERLFAVDKQVRKGQLKKHLKREKLEELKNEIVEEEGTTSSSGPRALVIEGAALKHMLGDPELEEIVFAVASSCEAVIACRVSPKQKALLVNLVRHHVKPEPVTLAIGDGANDVGMIQEAHVGIGISGKEGQQAVNASDFAIAQFRFLEDLVLIHGRWDFFRMSIVVMFSFYKNAVMAGCLVVFTTQTVFSGTPLFDEWIIAMLNFVAGLPIIVLGLFDRCLDKDYIRRNPQVYKPTRDNELMTGRTLARWILLVFVHIFTVYYLTVPLQARGGGGITSAFDGLMNSDDLPGNGEGGDLQSVGTVSFTCLIVLLAYKVLFESRSLIHGRWPAFTCNKDVGEGFFSRVAYTWWGVTACSIGFYLWAITIYQLIGRNGAGSFSYFVDVTNHVLGTRSLSWMIIAFVPILGMAFDVSGKVFSNMFYPTQTQIHIELQVQEGKQKKQQQQGTTTTTTNNNNNETSNNSIINIVDNNNKRGEDLA